MINDLGAECLICGTIKTWDEFGDGVYIGTGALRCLECVNCGFDRETKPNYAVELDCSKCGQIKPYSEFKENGQINNICVICQGRQNKERLRRFRAKSKR